MTHEVSPHAPAGSTGSAGGWVALVGGGPGSSGLITARGLELLGRADVVVVDALAPRDLLEGLGPGTEVIDASKRRGRHVMSQEEIDALLVDLARRGKGVVRLKGGDPYVLGRGGEEAAACRRAGVAVEVVPGITSAIAVPAAAGIPVTHRGLSRGFSVITAHADLGVLPQRRDHTLILLMGVSRLRNSVASLLAAGSDHRTRLPPRPARDHHRAAMSGRRRRPVRRDRPRGHRHRRRRHPEPVLG